MNEIPIVLILMATYNGEKFLKQQLKSIMEQTFQSWQLYVRDDGSNDGTIEILRWAASVDGRIKLIDDNNGHLGVVGNFSSLFEFASRKQSQYFAISDQDDVWQTDKLEQLFEVMSAVENQSDIPVLIHSDLEVVSENLQILDESLMSLLSIRHEQESQLNVLLVQNFVTGCTVLMNMALLKVALPIPEQSLMHDWWFALCATVFGKLEYLDKPLLKYRQHTSNQVGAKNIVQYLRGGVYAKWVKGRYNLYRSMTQARVLSERVRKLDPLNTRLSLIDLYSSLPKKSALCRGMVLMRGQIHTQSFLRQLAMISRLLSLPRIMDE